jgi:hypothetical protein
MNLSFRDRVRRLVPPWLSDRGKAVGFRLLYCLAAVCDAGAEVLTQGLQARFPGRGTPTALKYIGRDRGIRRGPGESDEAFAARLLTWLDDWRIAGSALSLLRQLHGFLSPNPPLLRLVTNSGVWYTMDPNGTFSIHHASPNNWNWDGETNGNHEAEWARFWLVIYSASAPWSPAGNWGGEGRWAGGQLWGFTGTPAEIEGFKAIVSDWRAAHARCMWVIVAFDAASFDPSAPPGSPLLPDGWWGPWHKVVGGVAVPSRLATARYFEVH